MGGTGQKWRVNCRFDDGHVRIATERVSHEDSRIHIQDPRDVVQYQKGRIRQEASSQDQSDPFTGADTSAINQQRRVEVGEARPDQSE
jgi:hypothetical protein